VCSGDERARIRCKEDDGTHDVLDLADAPESDDMVSETDGVRLVVDPMSLDLIGGSVVDFVESLGGAAFKVENPQAAAGCGCGASFGI
jgi:iron-sulfur cluster assembly accessory protein